MACRRPALRWKSAIDEVARAIGMDALEFRRRNVVRKGDKMIAAHESPDDVIYGSYGLDQCLDLVAEAMKRDDSKPPSPDWLVGQGTALTMIDTVPPGGIIRPRRSRCAATAATT